MKNRRVALKPIRGFRSLPFVPIEHERDVDDLIDIEDMVNQGEEGGLRAYLGEDRYRDLRGRAFEAGRMDQQRVIDERLMANRSRGGKERAAQSKKANIIRDRAIHDAASRGESNKIISIDMNVSESTVSRILRKPRP